MSSFSTDSRAASFETEVVIKNVVWGKNNNNKHFHYRKLKAKVHKKANQRKEFHTLKQPNTTNTMARSHKDLEDDIKNNENKIESLTEGLRSGLHNKDEEITSLRKEITSLKQEIKNKEQRIASVEQELRKSRGNEKSLKDKIEFLENEIQVLRNKNEELVERLKGMEMEMENRDKSMGARIDKLENIINQQENLFIIAEIVPALQKNMCKYVLGEHFSEKFYPHKFKDIETYIKEMNADPKVARERLEHAKKITSWNEKEHLLYSLNEIKTTRIGIAHPPLSSDNIQQARDYLEKETKLLDKKTVENINELKDLWETTEELLQTQQTGQKQDTYASRLGNPCTSRKANNRGQAMPFSQPLRKYFR